jgi:hypothetical protein
MDVWVVSTILNKSAMNIWVAVFVCIYELSFIYGLSSPMFYMIWSGEYGGYEREADVITSI